jgi:hypothetical protein
MDSQAKIQDIEINLIWFFCIIGILKLSNQFFNEQSDNPFIHSSESVSPSSMPIKESPPKWQ